MTGNWRPYCTLRRQLLLLLGMGLLGCAKYVQLAAGSLSATAAPHAAAVLSAAAYVRRLYLRQRPPGMDCAAAELADGLQQRNEHACCCTAALSTTISLSLMTAGCGKQQSE